MNIRTVYGGGEWLGGGKIREQHKDRLDNFLFQGQ